MGLFDKAKAALSEHKDQLEQAIDKAGDLADSHTDGKFSDQIDKAQDAAKKAADKLDD
jgi:uncharacterized protein YjbJ (UPF0337 family)